MNIVPETAPAGTLTFPQALHQVTDLARSKLPATLHDRLDRARTLAESGHVWVEDDGVHAAVRSLDDARWHTVNAACDCQDAAYRAEGGLCQHRLAVGLVRRAHELMHKPVILPEDETPPASPAGIPPQHVVFIQGRPFVRFAGLLQMAHAKGLQELRATWTYNDEHLSLAEAAAVFPFGTFTEGGDATPDNVTKKVAPHFRRVALTRSKARALRDALNCELVAVEELEGD